MDELPETTTVTIEELKKELLTLPVIIRKLRGTLIEQERELYGFVLQAEAVKTAITVAVSNETITNQSTGKTEKKYTNQQSRDAEVGKRLGTDAQYKHWTEKEKTYKGLSEETRKDIEYVQMRFKALRTIGLLVSGGRGEYE